jgi:outer membrane protein assembly factor BamA
MRRRLAFCRWFLGLVVFAAAPTLWAQVPRFSVGAITITNVGPQAASDSLIRGNIRVKEGEGYSRNAIDDDVRNLYATGFFSDVRVVEERRLDKVNLTYILQGKLKLTDLQFSGNKKYSTGKLKKKVTSKLGEPIDERKLFTDKDAILKMYQKAGLSETKVEYKIIPDERAGRGTVIYEIAEAPKIKLEDVYFDGASAFTQKKLRSKVKTRRWWWMSWITGSGKIKKDVLEDDKEKLAEFYRGEGYIDFDLKKVEIENRGPKKAAIHFEVSEGRQYKVGSVAVTNVTLFPTNEVVSKLKMGGGHNVHAQGLDPGLRGDAGPLRDEGIHRREDRCAAHPEHSKRDDGSHLRRDRGGPDPDREDRDQGQHQDQGPRHPPGVVGGAGRSLRHGQGQAQQAKAGRLELLRPGGGAAGADSRHQGQPQPCHCRE